MTERLKESVNAAKHVPTYDSDPINRAVQKANSDPHFVHYAVGQLASLQFPAFKQNIIDFARSINADKDIIALFESLNGYMEFRDQYHLYKALQENFAYKKKEFQISDETRENPRARTRPTTTDASMKDREAVDESEEREDYPKVARLRCQISSATGAASSSRTSRTLPGTGSLRAEPP
jgi:hypothetical protein